MSVLFEQLQSFFLFFSVHERSVFLLLATLLCYFTEYVLCFTFYTGQKDSKQGSESSSAHIFTTQGLSIVFLNHRWCFMNLRYSVLDLLWKNFTSALLYTAERAVGRIVSIYGPAVDAN